MKLDSQRARARFAAARVARLATADAGGQPHLVPVTFAVDGDQIGIGIDNKPKSTMQLKRLRNIAENPQVCALVDEYSDTWEDLWWARADGTAAIVQSEASGWDHWWDRLAARYRQYCDQRPTGPVIVISVTRWSGWAHQA